NRWGYYSKWLMDRPREKSMRHMRIGENTGLILVKQPQAANLQHFDCVFIVDEMSDTNFYRRGGPSLIPLYLYPDDQQSIEGIEERKANFNPEVLKEFTKNLTSQFKPEEILDYIYAVLHS